MVLQRYKIISILLMISSAHPWLYGRGESNIKLWKNLSDKPVYVFVNIPWWRDNKFAVNPQSTVEKQVLIPWEAEAGVYKNEDIKIFVMDKFLTDFQNFDQKMLELQALNTAKIQERSGPNAKPKTAALDINNPLLHLMAGIFITEGLLAPAGVKSSDVYRRVIIEQTLAKTEPIDVPIDNEKYDRKEASFKALILPDYSITLVPADLSDATINDTLKKIEEAKMKAQKIATGAPAQ